MIARRVCQVKRLGLIDYDDSHKLQEAFVEARGRDVVPDTLFLLEHPHVITLGRNAKSENVTASPEKLVELGVTLHETGRGGDATYHGPGQIVGYPILNLSPDRCDVRKYVRDIEEVLIRSASDFGIKAARAEGYPGIWVGDNKLAAIGIRISHWITMHGFALNVSTNLDYFNLIVPCGITDKGVTTLEKLTGERIPLSVVESSLARRFGEVFDWEMEENPIKHQSVQVVIFDDSKPKPKFLILKRTEKRGGYWQPVTGNIKRKKGEAPAETALREAKEETGIKSKLEDLFDLNYIHSFYIEPRLLKKSYPDPQLNREYSFALRTEKKDVKIDSDEHDDFKWVDYEEAMERMIWSGNKQALSLTRNLIINHEDHKAHEDFN